MVDDHIKVASQYEAIGDASAAAELRGVANMLAGLLTGGKCSTLHPELTPANVDEHRNKVKAIDEAEKAFADFHFCQSNDWEDECAYQEGANRVIAMVVRMPSAAKREAFLKGMADAVGFMRDSREPAESVK